MRVCGRSLFGGPVARARLRRAPAPVAQWIERCPPEAEVAGSNPAGRAGPRGARQGSGRAKRAATTEGERLRRNGVLVALALAATMVVGVSAAFAAKRYTTHIVFLGKSGPSLQDQTLYGDLNTNPKCRGARQLG